MRIVLASGSPRRRELLGNLGLEFEIMTDNSPETVICGEKPQDTVLRLSAQKAKNVAGKVSGGATVIAADTIVSADGKILGKPKDESDAFDMLKMLSGRSSEVYTGVTVKDTESGKTVSEFERTSVRFRSLSDDEIKRYIASGEPMDKAGAYGIQNLGALLIEGIDGDYFNVVGLPLCRLNMILKREFGINLL